MHKNTIKPLKYSVALRDKVLRAFIHCLGGVKGSAFDPSSKREKKRPDSDILSSTFYLTKAWQGLL